MEKDVLTLHNGKFIPSFFFSFLVGRKYFLLPNVIISDLRDRIGISCSIS